MERHRQDQPALGGLDESVVVHHEIAWSLQDQFRRRPGRAIIRRRPQIRTAIQPAVLHQVDHMQLAARRSQQRDAHHVIAAFVFHDRLRRSPGRALVVGMDLDEAGRTMVFALAAVISRVAEQDPAGTKRREGAFRIARIRRRRGHREQDLVRGHVERRLVEGRGGRRP